MEYSLELKLENRAKSTKSQIKKLRASGYSIGLIYGKTCPSRNVQIKSKAMSSVIQNPVAMSTIYRLSIENENFFAILKDIKVDLLSNEAIHFDFHIIQPNDFITYSCPIKLINQSESNVIKRGGLFNILYYSIKIKSQAKHIQNALEFDTSNLNIGDSICAKDFIKNDHIICLNPNQMIFRASGKKIQPEESSPSAQQKTS